MILELYLSLVIAVPIFVGLGSLYRRSKRFDVRAVSPAGRGVRGHTTLDLPSPQNHHEHWLTRHPG